MGTYSKTPKHQNIKSAIRSLLADQDSIANRDVVAATGITSQGAHYHLAAMVRDGELASAGSGRSVRYRVAAIFRQQYLRLGLEEDSVWIDVQSHLPEATGGPAKRVLRYAVTEMVNNAIDHSMSEWVEVLIWQQSDRILVRITDRGVGIFRHLRDHRGFPDDFTAIQALAKGKLTTAPDRHTGEGIFFTSKAVARFVVDSGGTHWVVDNDLNDIAVGSSPVHQGTVITLEVGTQTQVDLQELFQAHQSGLEFARTHLRLSLFATQSGVMSRSEARRVSEGLERFEEVVIDFEGVTTVGQGFADQLFRVWQGDHSGTRLRPINMIPEVADLVRRVAGEQSALSYLASDSITTTSSGATQALFWDFPQGPTAESPHQ
jgi:anti-sigma regulatory factor (Ser/Thr protein kinase)